MNISATNIAYQGIQSGFNRLADNTAHLNPNATSNTPLPENILLTPSSPPSLESMLLNNNRTQTQIESLAKVIKTEDNLIGQLFEDWA
ncbi:MAG: hypothetical protein ISEC1_P1252 [Thiomicrorhabdus sp.]|nr:MAG: hypothetical protein ISEC1_P1252 [Thiomicrorhabdus sp.]